MIVKSSKLSDFIIKKIIWCFCIDIDATKTSLIVKVNRNTVNRFFTLFRTVIWYHQLKEFKRVIQEEAEMDEAYFGGKRRRGVAGRRGRGSSKQPVFGIFERNGRVYPSSSSLQLCDLTLACSMWFHSITAYVDRRTSNPVKVSP